MAVFVLKIGLFRAPGFTPRVVAKEPGAVWVVLAPLGVLVTAVTTHDNHSPASPATAAAGEDCTKEAATAAEAMKEAFGVTLTAEETAEAATAVARWLRKKKSAGSFTGSRLAIDSAAKLAEVIYLTYDLHASIMDEATLALWNEAADVSRRIHADARKGVQ